MIFTYSSFLTHQLLHDFLKEVSTSLEVELRVPNRLFRWDFLVNGKLIVEFDGDTHYRDAFVIKRDEIKDKMAIELGYKTIRVPYFIQLTTQTVSYYFGDLFPSQINQNYAHGFIDKKACLPASFCSLGISKFQTEVGLLPSNIFEDIKFSLINKINEFGKQYVIEEKIKNTFSL